LFFILQKFLETGYDKLRRQPEKRAVVSALIADFGGQHDHNAIVKKWSDLKRRQMDQVRRLRAKYHPGKLLLTVMFFFKKVYFVRELERERSRPAGVGRPPPEAICHLSPCPGWQWRV
jgi:hypothetical protein